MQSTFKQHGFELPGSTYTWLFPTEYLLQYYLMVGWICTWERNLGFRGSSVKFVLDFLIVWSVGSLKSPHPPSCSRVSCIYISWKWKLLHHIWFYYIVYILYTILYSPWNSLGQNTGVGNCSLLPNPGIEPRSPALQVDSLPVELPGKPLNISQVISLKR